VVTLNSRERKDHISSTYFPFVLQPKVGLTPVFY
jgi:hypothetical protein